MPQLFKTKKVGVIGLGYIGLPTAAVLASSGYQVIGVDINPDKVALIQAGVAHIAEPDLDMLVKSAVSSGKFRASTRYETADVFIVAVPTPLNDDKSPNLDYVAAVFDSMAPHLNAGDLVILESTCPVGTTEAMVDRLYNHRPDLCHNIHVAYCPERVLPGQILRELIENDRVVGGLTAQCTEKAIEFYNSFVKGECLPTNVRTAEMCKLTENTFRDVNIAFANELSMLCEQQGIDVWELIKLANRHPRVNVLQPGPGVGGHCIAIDPWFIVHEAPAGAQLIKAARNVNDTKAQWVLQKITQEAERFQKQHDALPSIACLGLTFKANVDDTRESPALEIVANLASAYPHQVMIVEPNLEVLPEALSNSAVTQANLQTAIVNADMVVLLVDHAEFKKKSIQLKSKQIVLDFKGLWSK